MNYKMYEKKLKTLSYVRLVDLIFEQTNAIYYLIKEIKIREDIDKMIKKEKKKKRQEDEFPDL